MKLSPNFTLAELTTTGTGLDNSPTDLEIAKLEVMAKTLLQPLRDVVGPLRVNSGFRSDIVNRAVGGSSTSQHRKAEAADITPLRTPRIEVYERIIAMGADGSLPYGQNIVYEDTGHIHLSMGTKCQDLVKCSERIDGSYYVPYEKWKTLGREPLK